MKNLFFVVFLCSIGFVGYTQIKPTIAILSFTGGSFEDGETIPELFSYDQTLNNVFSIIPRTSINSAIRREQNFQMTSGMTDPETISRIGHQLGAKYIVAGSITSLGKQQLLVISIMQIENLQMLSGEWMKYTDIGEIQDKIPDISRTIINAYRMDTSKRQKLAILPFQTSRGDREADALAQIFAIEVVRSGTYAVFPRTKTLEQVQTEYRNQLNGDTADEYAIRIGKGENPLLALSGAVRSLGSSRRMFNASIINVESAVQIKGDTVNYNAIEEGVEAIWALASKLTSREVIANNSESFWTFISNINELFDTGNFTIILSCNINTAGRHDIRFTTNGRKSITIQGDSTERVITNGKDSPLIVVPNGITLVLGNNLRLNGNNFEQPAINILGGGALRIETGATISGSGGSGVKVGNGSSFTMTGGSISGNTDGGVKVGRGSLFNMTGGSISGNSSNSGGGVCLEAGGIFNMTGGSIINNRAITVTRNRYSYVGNGGGVWGWLTSNDPTIFIKTGGIIENNTSTGKGSQVFLANDIYVDGHTVRNRAAGTTVNLDSRVRGQSGGWE